MAKRVLIVNKFYYNRGGDCVVSLNQEQLLKESGYEVAFYSMSYPENFESEYSKYFAEQVEFSGGAMGKLKAMMRVLGLGDVRKSFTRLLKDFNPDVVHLNNIHSYISPIVAKLAKKHGCRVVWTLHDYKLLCPSYSCLREGSPCELCFSNKQAVVKNRCMKGSLVGSLLGYVEALRWNKSTLEKWVDTFICPSQFMSLKMVQGGFNPEKLRVMSNFVDPVKLSHFKSGSVDERKDYYCYIGRLSEEKGVATMLAAASQLPYELRVAGKGPLFDAMKEQYANCQNIKFLGFLNADQVGELVSKAKMSVIPSECYENNPLGVIESHCAGTPVVGARNGGIPELINASNGIVFTPKDVEELKSAITQAMTQEWDNASIKANAIETFSPATALKALEKFYFSK